jgi:hypothetical protein
VLPRSAGTRSGPTAEPGPSRLHPARRCLRAALRSARASFRAAQLGARQPRLPSSDDLIAPMPHLHAAPVRRHAERADSGTGAFTVCIRHDGAFAAALQRVVAVGDQQFASSRLPQGCVFFDGDVGMAGPGALPLGTPPPKVTPDLPAVTGSRSRYGSGRLGIAGPGLPPLGTPPPNTTPEFPVEPGCPVAPVCPPDRPWAKAGALVASVDAITITAKRPR